DLQALGQPGGGRAIVSPAARGNGDIFVDAEETINVVAIVAEAHRPPGGAGQGAAPGRWGVGELDRVLRVGQKLADDYHPLSLGVVDRQRQVHLEGATGRGPVQVVARRAQSIEDADVQRDGTGQDASLGVGDDGTDFYAHRILGQGIVAGKAGG